MARNGTQKQTQQTQSSKQQPDPTTYELRMSWRMRWFFAFLCVLSSITAIISLLQTRNPYYLTLIPAASPILLFAKSLIPMDNKTYRLKVLKIQTEAQVKAQKQREKRCNNEQAPNKASADDSSLQLNVKPPNRQKLHLVQRDEPPH